MTEIMKLAGKDIQTATVNVFHVFRKHGHEKRNRRCWKRLLELPKMKMKT